MSATAIIDYVTKKRSSPGPSGSGELLDSVTIPVTVCPGTATNLVAGSSDCRTADMNLLVAIPAPPAAPNAFAAVGVICRLCAAPV